MPKVKAPYKVIMHKDKIYGDGWVVKVGDTTYCAESKTGVNHVCEMLNEAYVHGYRNGMRAGRNMK